MREGGRAARPPPHPRAPLPPQRAGGVPMPYRPAVTTPPLSAKNRPFSRGPEKHGVTPTTRVGGPRGRPSSLSLLTQPLKPLTATCGAQTGWCGEGPGAPGGEFSWGVGWGARWFSGVWGGTEVLLTEGLGLKPLAGRPPTKRVRGRGLPGSRRCWPGSSRSWARTPSITSWIRVFSHRTDTWGREGACQSGSSQGPARVPCPQGLTMCHRPARERRRLWTRSRGPGPSV